MTIESALHSYLTTELETDANLSAVDSVQVYPDRAPQTAAYPFINYSLIGVDIENRLNNTNPALFTLTTQTVDLAIWAASASDRALILTSLKDHLHGFSGDIGTEALNIRSAQIDSISTFSENDITGNDLQIYRANITLSITYNWS